MNIHYRVYNHCENNCISRMEKKVMQVDLTLQPESLPDCIRPMMVAPGTLRSILWLTKNKGPPQKKTWSGTMTREYVDCDGIHHP